MKHVLFIVLFLHKILLPAQPNIQWQSTLGGEYSDEAKCIRQTNDGGFIVAGNVLSNNGDVSGNHGAWDFWVVKLDYLGSIEWKKTLGGTDNDWPYAIQQTNDGGYIVAGFTESNNGDVTGNHGDKDAWVIKLNSAGTVQWKKVYGGSAWESAYSIQQTLDGGYIFAGIAQSTDGDVVGVHGDLDFWIVKLDHNGSMEWQKTLGGSSEDIANSIIQTADAGFIVAGRTISNDGDVSGNNGGVDYWIIKLDHSGGIEWQKALGGTSTDVAFDIAQTENAEYIICGYAASSNGDITDPHGAKDIWIVRLNGSGEIIWQKSLGGSDQDWGYSIAATSDDGIIITGSTRSSDGDILFNHGYDDVWLVKLNSIGEIVWQKTWGGTQSEVAFSIQQTSDTGYILGGYSWSNDGDVSGVYGSDDFWVVKLSPSSSPTTSPQPAPLVIYPNPTHQLLSVQLPDSFPIEPGDVFPLTIRVTDLPGREVMRQTIVSEAPLNIEAIPNGLYLLTATTNSGKVFSGRFVKQE